MRKRDTWGLGPFTVRRQAPDVRAGGRMSRVRDGPDVRAGLGLPNAFGDGGAGFPGEGGRMSGVMAGCPGYAVPLRCSLVGRCRISGAGAGCPAAVVAGPSSFSFLHFHARLALVLGLSMVSSGVPEYAQGPRLK